MYLWKCWRDTRSIFLVSLVAAFAVMPIAVLVLGAGLLTDSGPVALASTFFLVTLITALGLGALAANEQFSGDAVHFLFTKPRPRSYFLWVAWAVALCEFLAIAVVGFSVGWTVLCVHRKSSITLGLSRLIEEQHLIETMLYCLLIYCLTYAVTVVLRSGFYGLGATLLIMSALQALPILMWQRFHIHVPTPGQTIGSLPHSVSVVVWEITELLFVYTAQRIVNRSEF